MLYLVLVPYLVLTLYYRCRHYIEVVLTLITGLILHYVPNIWMAVALALLFRILVICITLLGITKTQLSVRSETLWYLELFPLLLLSLRDRELDTPLSCAIMVGFILIERISNWRTHRKITSQNV